MKIKFYAGSRGIKEVEKFIRTLSPDEFSKTGKVFDLLEQYGTEVTEPLVKQLEGKIWEIRVKGVRFLYFRHQELFVLLSAFRKSGDKTPRSEIEKAQKRMKDYLERGE